MIYVTNDWVYPQKYHEVKSYISNKNNNNNKISKLIELCYSNNKPACNVRLSGPYMYDKFYQADINTLRIIMYKICWDYNWINYNDII